MPSLFQKPVPFRIISDYGFIVINSAFLIMGTNQMVIFDALTLSVFNKDFEEFSNTCAHTVTKQRNFVLMTFFLASFQLLQHSIPFYALNDLCPRKS